MKEIAYTTAIVAWVFGIAAAHGFWQTAGAYLCPPYAWVVLAEKLLPAEQPDNARGEPPLRSTGDNHE